MNIPGYCHAKSQDRVVPCSGFTMIEIALSLAVIGFALVAIIGVLPTGMDVQKQNRQETIINQDMSIWVDGIRNGQHGLDDLTNYVLSITNYRTPFLYQGRFPKQSGPTVAVYYTPIASRCYAPEVPLTNGFNIIGLLSTPKYITNGTPRATGFISNYVVCYARSMSGPASEKYPQTNTDVQSFALQYRMVPEVIPFASYDPDWTNYTASQYAGLTNEIVWRSNYFVASKSFQTDLHELRLLFRWPVFSTSPFGGGTIGNGRQVFRTMVGGFLTSTNLSNPPRLETTLYFIEPRTYVRAP